MAIEQEVRQGVQEILGGGAKLANLSQNTIDDAAIAAAQQAVANDLLWGWMWRMIELLFDDEDGLIVSSENVAEELKAEAAVVGLDPATIIAIITAIVQLIKLFRNR